MHDRPLIEQMAVAYATEIERLQGEVKRLRNELELAEQYYKEREEVESENAKLRAALEEIVKMECGYETETRTGAIARAALANEGK